MGILRNENGTFAPGNVSNPGGVNQWSRREEVERLWQQLLDEVDVEQGRSRIEAILDRLIAEAEAGKSWAIGMVLDRILPATRRDEIEVNAKSLEGPYRGAFMSTEEIEAARPASHDLTDAER